MEQERPPSDRYDTMATRGDEMLLRLCNAGLPNETKSCGRYCSGALSMRSLLSTGSNVVEMFSLSSDGYDDEKGSLL